MGGANPNFNTINFGKVLPLMGFKMDVNTGEKKSVQFSKLID